MLLERLVLSNFKRFREADIRFRDGITGIVGNNGTGKSSIVEAILFALYGVKGTGVNSDYIVSSFAGLHDFCEVRLDFTIGGFEYSVLRKFRKGTHDASLFFRPERSDEEMKELAKSVSEVMAKVQEIIGMGPADFRNTIYAAQKDLLTLLETQPHARREWFMKALGIEFLRNRSDELLRERVDRTDNLLRIARAKSEALGAEEDIARIDEYRHEFACRETEERDLSARREILRAVSEKHEELRAAEQALGFASRQLVSEEEILRNLSAERDRHTLLEARMREYRNLEQDLARLREREPRFRELTDEIRNLEAGIETRMNRWHQVMDELESFIPAKEDLAGLEETPRLLDEKRTLERALLEARNLDASRKELRVRSREVTRLIREKEERIREYDERLAGYPRLIAEITEAEKQQKETERQHADFSARLTAILEEQATLAADKDRVETAGPAGTCPLCQQVLGGHYEPLTREIEQKIRSRKEEEHRIRTAMEQVLQRSEHYEKMLLSGRNKKEELDRLQLTLADLKARKESDESALAGIMAEIVRKEDELRGLGTEGYDPLVHQNLTGEITRLEAAMDRRGRILALLQREPALEAERDLLVDELQKIRETQLTRRVERDDAGYDDAGRQRLETALQTLRPVRDEYISLTDRLSHEPEIIARRDAACREQAAEHERVERVKAGLAALGWSGEAAPDVRAVLNSTEEALRVCTAQKTRISERISRILSVMEQLRAAQDEIARLRDELELVRATRRVVAEYIIYLMQVVRSRIEGDVSRILGEITAGRYDRVLLDEDFNLLVRDIDNDYPVERFSGGEQDDIAVALRIALSRYLAALHRVPESTFLIFDEIFGSQDEERRNSLLLALRTQEAYFPQILLISHIPEMQGEFANTLLVELGSDQDSRITEASQ